MCIIWSTLLVCYSHVEVLTSSNGRHDLTICSRVTPFDGLTPQEDDPSYWSDEECQMPHDGCAILYPQQLAFGYCGDCAFAIENGQNDIFSGTAWYEVRVDDSLGGRFFIDSARPDEGQVALSYTDARRGRVRRTIREHGLQDATLFSEEDGEWQ